MALVLASAFASSGVGRAAAQNAYVQQNLVSDLAGQANLIDANLLNPWGIAKSPGSPFAVANNHSGLATFYNSSGGVVSPAVMIPSPLGGNALTMPTGLLFNNTTNFQVSPGTPATFLLTTEDGTICGWGGGTNAVLLADNSGLNAVYKGIALGTAGGSNLLYAANFYAGTIDVFGPDFKPATLPGSFTDPNLPAGFAPFNVQNLGGSLYVTYAMQDADKTLDVTGAGNGFVSIFDTSGHLVKRFASQGMLNSPWGLAIAPTGFGTFSGSLLIGNSGDGLINAFDPSTGALLGHLQGTTNSAISIEGLHGLTFSNGGSGGNTSTLYFAAGISGGGTLGDHGLLGTISVPSAAPLITSVTATSQTLTIIWAGGTGPYVLQKKTSLSDANWIAVLTNSAPNASVRIDAVSAFFRVVSH